MVAVRAGRAMAPGWRESSPGFPARTTYSEDFIRISKQLKGGGLNEGINHTRG
jgi:hypothetical protein